MILNWRRSDGSRFSNGSATIVRTRFVAVDGEPQQVIDAAVPVALPVEDLRAVPAEEQRARVRA
ncbi:MAG: hypothetical protein ACRD2A_08615, partial [Vicinamibacterales bacterium]